MASTARAMAAPALPQPSTITRPSASRSHERSPARRREPWTRSSRWMRGSTSPAARAACQMSRAWRPVTRSGLGSGDDDVAFDGIDLDTTLLEPRDTPLQRLLGRLHLQRHPAVVGLHVGPADVDEDVEVLDEPIEDRLLDEAGGKGQSDAHPSHARNRGQLPPAMARTMESVSPSLRTVFLPSTNRMSSSLT